MSLRKRCDVLHRGGLATLCLGLQTLCAGPVFAGYLRAGDAIISGFSGVSAPATIKPGTDPNDWTMIDVDGASAAVWRLDALPGGPRGQRTNAPIVLRLKAGDIGQVFGIEFDDGTTAAGGSRAPNAYLTATSAYGLNVVAPGPDGKLKRLRLGGPGARWMPGQFGEAKKGNPGTIWKLDGETGEVAPFASVALQGRANDGPGLGNLAFDRATHMLYVSDRETGMIHRFDMNGADLGYFDHGKQGRPKAGLQPVAFDSEKRVSIDSRTFDTQAPSTWGFAPKERAVWGLAIRKNRLYYAVDDGPSIWSVGLAPDGHFETDVRIEALTGTKLAAAPISDIQFDASGTMYVSQRGATLGVYDYGTFAEPGSNALHRFKRSGEAGHWQADGGYVVGALNGRQGGSGGVALGPDYDANGKIDPESCDQTIWATGDQLGPQSRRGDADKPADAIVHGASGSNVGDVGDAPSPKSFLLGFDGAIGDLHAVGHVGDIDVFQACPGRGDTPSVATPAEPEKSKSEKAAKSDDAGDDDERPKRKTRSRKASEESDEPRHRVRHGSQQRSGNGDAANVKKLLDAAAIIGGIRLKLKH